MYNDMDIMLDSWPYCGTITSVECLMMGVPIVTLQVLSSSEACRISRRADPGVTASPCVLSRAVSAHMHMQIHVTRRCLHPPLMT